MRINPSIDVADEELRLRFSRSGGPGGQNVNTRDTRVEVVFDVAGSPSLGEAAKQRIVRNLAGKLDSDGKLHVVASDERTQAGNRELALGRLKTMLAEAARPDPAPRRPTRPSKAAVRRRVESKRIRGRLKRQRSSAPEE